MDSSKHTPHSKLPWQVVEWANRDKDGAVECTGTQIADAEGYLISGCTIEGCSEQEEADVAFIVRAVNSHDQLTNALRLIRSQSTGADWTAEQALNFIKLTAKAALAAAEA